LDKDEFEVYLSVVEAVREMTNGMMMLECEWKPRYQDRVELRF
jgi:hypothetical protein